MVENTTQRDPLVNLVGMLGEGTDDYILGMEAAGGAQLLASSLMPAEADWDNLTALGFTKGDPVPGDDLFVNCTLPAGWTRKSLSDPRGSVVLDERGIERVSVFYKAAFYDRKANAYTINVGRHYSTQVLYGDGEPTLPEEWPVMTEVEREDFWGGVADMQAKIAEHPGIYGKYEPRVLALLAERDGEPRG